MEACLSLGRSQRNLNKQKQKDLKLQDQHQKQHTQMQQQKLKTQTIITNQNYYTTQQQPPNQRHLVALGQTTNIRALKPELQQQQHNEESHSLRQEQQQNVQHNATTTPYRNTAATTSNMQQPSLSTTNDCPDDVGSVVQQQPKPQPTSFQKNTVAVEVTPMLPSTVNPANTPGIVANANVETFRKINRQAQQQQQYQKQQQQQFQHHHLLHQQQQNEADLDAIELRVDPEPHVYLKGGGGLLRQTKTLGRFNQQHQHHQSIEYQHGECTETTSLQLLQLQQQQQQQQQHDYCYAYYEPGAVMRHTNIPHAELIVAANDEEDIIPPPPDSIRALLLKGKKNKLMVSATTRQSYQTRLTQQQSHNVAGAMASASCSSISTPENFYEEISASSTSSSSNSISSPQQLSAPSHLAGSLTRTLVEEELRRVQNRHHKILSELNLSVEAMLMPESPPDSGSTTKEPPMPAVSVTTASGQPLRLISSSADNIRDTALVGGPADDFISPIPNSAMVSAGLLQSSCVAADFDSGFSGSSGASYIGSLRLHKTKALISSRSNKLSSTTTAAAGSNPAAESQQSAFDYTTQCCRSFQRANSNNTNAAVTSSSSTVAAVSATTSSCTIKHLPQIHHNTKQKQQQQQLHMQHQHQHHHHYLHQQQQHQQHQQSQHVNDDLHNSSGFFTRASCGCRILNCAKIRAAEDPGPVVLNAQPNASKARSFWNRKGWSKPSIFNDPG